MAMTTQRINIDINTTPVDPIVMRVGESYNRVFEFVLGRYEDDVFVPLTYTWESELEPVRAKFRLLKPDKTFVITDMIVTQETDGTKVFSIMQTPIMSQVGGVGYYDIRVCNTSDDTEFAYSVQGKCVIDDDMITDEMIESVASANGYVFPDDFLTKGDFDPDDYATKQYVDSAISEIPKSSLIELYNNNTAIGASSITVANHEKYKFYIFEFYHYVTDISNNKLLTYFCVNANGNYIFSGCSTSVNIMYGRDIVISGNNISWGDGVQPGVQYSNNYFIPHKIYGLEV